MEVREGIGVDLTGGGYEPAFGVYTPGCSYSERSRHIIHCVRNHFSSGAIDIIKKSDH